MKQVNTFAEYMADEERISEADRAAIRFEAALIRKMVEAREHKGLSQRALAKLSGVQQPVIARLERMNATPQVDTLLRLLVPLGYTLDIVPLQSS